MGDYTKTMTNKNTWRERFDKLYHPEFEIWKYANPDTDPGGITMSCGGRLEVLSFIEAELKRQRDEIGHFIVQNQDDDFFVPTHKIISFLESLEK